MPEDNGKNGAFDLTRSRHGVEAVLGVCRGRGRVLVLMQNNPDPDAIASAAALRDLVHASLHKRVTIGYAGICGRAENQAMLRELRIDAERLGQAALKRFKTICLVDTQPQSGNNLLYTSRPVDIVIDHHLISKRRKAINARFADIRPEYGATATILYEYVLAANMDISSDLATALFYGIQSDTQYLAREAASMDTAAYMALFERVDRRKLAIIRRAPLPASYFGLLHEGLENTVVAGRTVLTSIWRCDTPDMIAEVADMMLRLRDVRASVCYGMYDDRIHLSARAVDARTNAAERVRKVVRGIGTGGGHRSMAAGQVPVQGRPEERMALVRDRILRVFAPGRDPVPLCANGCRGVRDGQDGA